MPDPPQRYLHPPIMQLLLPKNTFSDSSRITTVHSFNFRFPPKFLFPHRSCPLISPRQAVPNAGVQELSGGSSCPGAMAQSPGLLQELPQRARAGEAALHSQLLLCSLLELTPPKQSEEIKCSTYFGLQEMRTPTSLGFSRQLPTDALHSFIFHIKQCRNNHKPALPPARTQHSQDFSPQVPEAPHLSSPAAAGPQHPTGGGTPCPWPWGPCCDCPQAPACARGALQPFPGVPGSICGEISPNDPR